MWVNKVSNSNKHDIVGQVSQAAKSIEGMAGIRRAEEDDRRLQWDLPPAGDDGQQGHDDAPLGEDRPDYRPLVRRRGR